LTQLSAWLFSLYLARIRQQWQELLQEGWFMSFKDHFSAHADIYATARPDYPAALFDFLAANCADHELAWDCATGNGQAALPLARCFHRVIASDASAAQLQLAPPHPAIDYRHFEATVPDLKSESVDLVCVAQALHWFQTEKFFDSVNRVLKPGGVLAVWSYGLMQIDARLDSLVQELYEGVLGPYWPPERRLLERGYIDIEFPFIAVTAPRFEIRKHWNQRQVIAYLQSWSACRRYRDEHGADPLAMFVDRFQQAWGSALEKDVVWPLTVNVRRK
jgi:SAM-dependent methyltransferase